LRFYFVFYFFFKKAFSKLEKHLGFLNSCNHAELNPNDFLAAFYYKTIFQKQKHIKCINIIMADVDKYPNNLLSLTFFAFLDVSTLKKKPCSLLTLPPL
jgi:hypothetical protein